MKLIFKTTIVACVLFTKLSAQSVTGVKEYTYTTGVNVFNGFVIKHDQLMGYLSQGRTSGIEIYMDKNTYGRKEWEKVFNYPDAGFSLSYFDYGVDALGQSIAGMLYMNFYPFRSRYIDGLIKLGTGFGIHTKPYDHDTNNENVALGCRLTSSMQLRTGLKLHITNRWDMTTYITLSHFSVAALAQPNKGVNILTANVGCAYRITRDIPVYYKLDENYHWKEHLTYNVNFNYAVKEIPPIGGPEYPVYDLSFYVNKQISRTNILNIGIDGFNNTALKEEMKQENIDPKSVDNKRIGINIGHELKINRISILTQFGGYIYRPYKTDKPVYQRIALNFYLTKHTFIHYGFITHFAKADHYEWGMGISL